MKNIMLGPTKFSIIMMKTMSKTYLLQTNPCFASSAREGNRVAHLLAAQVKGLQTCAGWEIPDFVVLMLVDDVTNFENQ